MIHKLLLDNQKKRLSVHFCLLICFSMFIVWQMGFIYYMGPALNINGKTPLPIDMDNVTMIIACGYIFSILCLFALPHKIIHFARISTAAALFSAIGIFLPLSAQVLTLLLYTQCFCCCFLIGFETGIIVQLFSEESAVKHLLVTYPISYILIAILQNNTITISFSHFRFFIIIMLCMLLYFFCWLPCDRFPQFVKKSDGLVFPKRFFIGMYTLFFLSAILGVASPAVVAEIPNGVAVYYIFMAIFSLIVYIIYRKTSFSPLQFISILLALAAFGYVLLFASLYIPGLSYLSCIFISIGTIPCALIPLFGLIMAKQYPSKYIPGIIISLALAAVLVHSAILELFRSSLPQLYFAYLLLVIILVFLYLLLEPFMLYAFHRKFPSSADADVPIADTAALLTSVKEAADETVKDSVQTQQTADNLTENSADSATANNELPKNTILSILTKRELEVLHLIGLGHTNKEIAQILIISEHTVNDYTKKIYRKLNVHNRHAAAQFIDKLKF